ncbi:MAG: hypothetical protein VX951_10245 [Planctomycetota bacterium]|nr:hypothetical protein [Planctomycetota bacterium]
MQAKVALLFLVFAAGAGTVTYQFLWNDSADVSDTPEALPEEKVSLPDSPKELKGDAPAAKVEKPKKKSKYPLEEENIAASADRLQLPNGKSVPILNGAYGAKNGWPSDIPYSPIIKVQIDGNGERYYLHEDGSQTKTLNRMNTATGKMVVVTQVSNPVDPVPMDPEEIARVSKEEKRRAANKKGGNKKGGNKKGGNKKGGNKK